MLGIQDITTEDKMKGNDLDMINEEHDSEAIVQHDLKYKTILLGH